MYTFQIVLDQVNGRQNNQSFYVSAENKIDCADKVSEAFGFPTSISYSMHELDIEQDIERLFSQLISLNPASAQDFVRGILNN